MKLLKCTTEEEYEKFVFFLLQNRYLFDEAFGESFSLFNAIGSLYLILGEENVLLILNDQDEVCGFACYTYGTRENQFEDQHVVFINCVALQPNYRSTRTFLSCFKQLTRLIQDDRNDIKEFRFYAYRDHEYVQRLYRKFATVVGEIEDQFAVKDIFSVDFPHLCEYLENFKNREGRKEKQLYTLFE